MTIENATTNNPVADFHEQLTTILPRLREGFMPALLSKGRMRAVLETIPVHVILDGDVGLRGAAS